MGKVGFIGYGSMGSMLVNGFLSSGELDPSELIIASRSKTNIRQVAREWPQITIAETNEMAVKGCCRLFICVKPLQVLPLIESLSDHLDQDTHIISIAASVTLADIEYVFNGRVTKVIPSVTSEVQRGISLICHNKHTNQMDEIEVDRFFRTISTPIEIDENAFEVAADFTSCAPGMIAAIFQNFTKSGIKHAAIDKDVAVQMVCATLIGTARLIEKNQISFSQLISRVATKGGITEEAVKTLNNELPDTFDKVFEQTLTKHDHIKSMVQQQKRGNDIG